MLRKILQYPDPRLAEKSVEVKEINDDIRKIAQDMLDTLTHIGGVGIAAPQIGELMRMIIVDTALADPDAQEQKFLLIINPVLTILDKKKHIEQEGCLSVANLRSDVARPCHVRVEGIDLEGKPISLEGKEYLSTCIQHEYDHIEGKTFIEHLSYLKKSLYIKKLQKM